MNKNVINKAFEELTNRSQEDPRLHRPKKVLPNQPCPCGSGKKYKKCCGLIAESGAAQISPSECKLFYETWYKLLDFVNQKLKVINYKFSLKYPDFHDETLLYKIREKLWRNPELIGEFLRDTDNLSNEEISLLQSWEKHHTKGKFVIVRYEPEYAVFLTLTDDVKLYAVKGMTDSIAKSLHRQLPAMVETVLLPFGDKIVYDSYMDLNPYQFNDKERKMCEGVYKERMEEEGIIIRINGMFSNES